MISGTWTMGTSPSPFVRTTGWNRYLFSFIHYYSPVAEAPLVEPCTACSEAKYELIFEGLWSRHTHPRDFPRYMPLFSLLPYHHNSSDEWQTQFSKLIGASHGINYNLWK